MINKRIFKAYDIRGFYPKEISSKTAFEIGKILSRFFFKGKIVVARDGRIGSPQLYRAVIKGLKANETNKLKTIEVGLATTPMFYFLVIRLKAVGGVMVTASHNPKEYNGFKVVGKNAEMISGYELQKFIR